MKFYGEDKRAIAGRVRFELTGGDITCDVDERAAEAFMDGIAFAMRCNCMRQEEIDELEDEIARMVEEMGEKA